MLPPRDVEHSSVDSGAYYLAGYLRVASLAIALYDFLETLPTTRRFYMQQWQSRRLTTSGLLFFLIQSSSITIMVISSVGFFYSNFTPELCQRFYILPPIFKVIQLMVSQAILGIRVFNLARRSVKVGMTIAALFLTASILEWVTNVSGRTATFDTVWKNCRGVPSNGALGSWICYALAIIYDVTMTAISAAYLLQHHLSATSSLMSRLTKMMIYDGLFYFVVLTAVNVVNLLFYHSSSDDVRTAATSLCFALTWIMSQRLLIHLHNAATERRNESLDQVITISQTMESQRQISAAMRSQLDRKSNYSNLQLTIPDISLSSTDTGPESGGIEVRIERTFKVDRRPGSYSLENYSRNARSWDRRQG